MNTESLINRLEDIPNRIARTVVGWSDTELHAQPAAGDWSAIDILAHLRAASDILTPRIYKMLLRDNPSFLAYEERDWAAVLHYTEADFNDLLQAYTLLRKELVTALHHLTPEQWQRTGLHETYGSLTVLQLASDMVHHEEEHCRQLEALRPQIPAVPITYARALLMDAEAESRARYKALLEKAGFEVVEAGDNAVALDILLADPNFLIVLADFDVLGQHDLNFLDSLRVIYPRLPVVVLGADQDLEWETMARERGAEAFFYEPVNMQDVLDTVLSLTEQLTY